MHNSERTILNSKLPRINSESENVGKDTIRKSAYCGFFQRDKKSKYQNKRKVKK